MADSDFTLFRSWCLVRLLASHREMRGARSGPLRELIRGEVVAWTEVVAKLANVSTGVVTDAVEEADVFGLDTAVDHVSRRVGLGGSL